MITCFYQYLLTTTPCADLDAPTNIFAQDETEFSFRVHWDPPQAEIDGYMLTYSSSEGSSEEIVIGSDSTSYTLTGLRPGVLYTVYIWAVKGSKASRKISTQAETGLRNLTFFSNHSIKWLISKLNKTHFLASYMIICFMLRIKIQYCPKVLSRPSFFKNFAPSEADFLVIF